MIFKFHLKSCLPSALRSLILQKKPNTRNMSNMSRGECRPASVMVLPRPLALAFEKFCQTAVSCAIIPGFCCPLVITMMPAPKDKLGRLVQATCTKPRGIHFLFPSEELLGIRDLSKPDYGEVVVCQPGHVPVFWPSQLTSLEAVGSCIMSGLKRAPDVSSLREFQRSITFSQDPLHHSTASASAIQRISELKVISAIDPGNKPVTPADVENTLVDTDREGECELLRASQARSHVHSVLLTTGFPMYFNYQPPDRLPGAVALAAILQALEKRASMVFDQRALSLHKKLVDEAAEQGILKTSIQILTYQGRSVGDAQAFLCRDGDPKSPRHVFDHLVAFEHAERAATTTMRGRGTLNTWGTLLMTFSLVHTRFLESPQLLCEVHRHYQRKVTGPFRPPGEQNWTQALPSVTKEEKLPGILVQHGVWNRLSGTLGTEVYRLLFHGTHAQMTQKLMGITLP
ncbi:unnamed protein product [Rangifer tarandus platyrhynchus]|uniref:Uncharacterized protein n=1 Tax=Rangifer tarandus platyrhynchus TaxID=3082113 RepID=A0AC59YJ01_RANTA